jgi:sorbitol/mannitol transport system permease protein
VSVLNHSKKENRKRRLPLYPALILTIILTQIPFVVTLIISTFHWNIMYPKETKFAWFENFKTVVMDDRMRAALKNSITLTFGVVFFSTALGLLLAILLDRKFHGRGIVRTLLITPFLITPVASALMWKHIMFNPMYGILDGFATQIYRLFGGEGVIAWDFVSQHPLVAIAVPMIWQWTPFMMLIILAGLQSQSPDILEAAAVDGANSKQIFIRMTFPHLRQYIQLAVVLGTIYIVQSMDFVFTITQGGPGTDSTIIPYQIYLTMFRKYEYGEAAAAGVIVIILTIILSNFALRLTQELIESENL